MVSKSGTNQVHGVGYYYRRDAAMNANTWFANSRNSPLADSYRNWLGGTMGGPVYLPKIYNGKNRTFFFFDFDYYKQLSATTSTASVPTAQQLTGDFSNTRLANGNLVPIYDPYNTFVNSSGATVRNLIPGNIIPLSRQNPITLKFIKYFPARHIRWQRIYARQQLVRLRQHALQRSQTRRQDRPQYLEQAALLFAVQRGLDVYTASPI